MGWRGSKDVEDPTAATFQVGEGQLHHQLHTHHNPGRKLHQSTWEELGEPEPNKNRTLNTGHREHQAAPIIGFKATWNPGLFLQHL